MNIGQISVSIYLLSLFGVIFSAATLGERLALVQIVVALIVVAATVLPDSRERIERRGVGFADLPA